MTVFAPDDRAFEHLPEGLRAYLFSESGRPALKKLLQYHVAPDVLFYTGMSMCMALSHFGC